MINLKFTDINISYYLLMFNCIFIINIYRHHNNIYLQSIGFILTFWIAIMSKDNYYILSLILYCSIFLININTKIVFLTEPCEEWIDNFYIARYASSYDICHLIVFIYYFYQRKHFFIL